MDNKQEKICAVVVTYNRKDLLLECLDSILKQTYPLHAIYIIDNASTDGTPVLLKKKGYIKEILQPIDYPLESESKMFMSAKDNKNELKIHYVRIHKNIGGAGGFYEGVKRGYEKGYDWLWLMDDDAEPEKDCLKILLNSINLLSSKISALTPLKIDTEGEIQKVHRGYINREKGEVIPLSKEDYSKNENLLEIDYSSFVGLLISKKAVAEKGFPDKDFFIWYDDVEYCWRLNDYGKIYLNKKAIIIHKDRVGEKYKNNNYENIENLWKRYYGKRNSLFLRKKYSNKKNIKFWVEIIYIFLRNSINIIVFMDYKILRLKLLCLAYIHAIFNIKGERISPAKWVKRYKYKKS